jgi:hypothetical protein
LKEEALDHSQWRSRFGRGYGPVVRQTAEWMKHSVAGTWTDMTPTSVWLVRNWLTPLAHCKSPQCTLSLVIKLPKAIYKTQI